MLSCKYFEGRITSKNKLSCFLSLTFLFLFNSAFCQQQTQVVKGSITDKASERPLDGVSVNITGTSFNAVSDSSGRYLLQNVSPGRYKIVFSCQGYFSATIPEVIVNIGKETIVDVALEQLLTSLKEIRVTGVDRGVVSSEFSVTSARSFNMNEVTKFSGGRNDPSRLMSNFAGVSTTNDSRNDLVVRGNSPSALLWRMEGIPIPNPNHFSNLGTTGGPVSAVNTNALKNSDFYSSAFTAEYGNTVGAVFDLNLREGNKDKFEKLIQVNLFSGLEVMVEGPLNKQKDGSSFLLGYRYSFAEIGHALGIPIGTNAVPKYYDWVANFSFAKSKNGTFNLFSIGGRSHIDFIGSEIDSTDLFANKNQDMYFKSNFDVFGMRHTINIGNNSYVRSVIAYSSTGINSQEYGYYDSLPQRRFEEEQKTNTNTLTFSSYYNSKINTQLTIRGGILGEVLGINTNIRDRVNKPDWVTTSDYNNRTELFQPFIQARYRFTDKFSAVAGIHTMFFALNNSSSIEPRISFSFAVNASQTFSFGYGLHSQLQPLPIYFYQQQLADGSYDFSNRALSFTKANHFVIGYEWRFLKDWRLKSEAYYQSLYHVPVERESSGFSVLNAGADFSFPEKGMLVNHGTGVNKGLEITLEKFFSSGTYLLLTTSLFDSKYKGSDLVGRNTTFNNKSIANLLAGHEFKIGKQKTNVFSVDFKMATSGGRYYTPIDLAASVAANEEKLNESSYNTERLPNYFRIDTRFSIRLNSRKRKVSQTLYVDLQNVTNRKNIFVKRYNTITHKVGNVYQTGFFPDLLYRLQF